MSKELFKRIFSSVIIIPIVFFFVVKGSMFFNLFVIVILIITFYEWHYLSFNQIYYLPGFVFIFFSFYTFYFLRNEGDYQFFWLILLTCIATDIGGYIFGKILKGPKLTKISPKKTYAGMFGGFLLSVILVIIYIQNTTFILPTITKNDEEIKLISLVLSISFISQAGDLIISLFKRKLKVKNTGEIIPGHGGILDRIDGMIFAFPYAFTLIKII
tara:strand:+ start:244 stop:888 length:645 start_codon:yes stop_codon:yes gene_type:complete